MEKDRSHGEFSWSHDSPAPRQKKQERNKNGRNEKERQTDRQTEGAGGDENTVSFYQEEAMEALKGIKYIGTEMGVVSRQRGKWTTQKIFFSVSSSSSTFYWYLLNFFCSYNILFGFTLARPRNHSRVKWHVSRLLMRFPISLIRWPLVLHIYVLIFSFLFLFTICFFSFFSFFMFHFSSFFDLPTYLFLCFVLFCLLPF